MLQSFKKSVKRKKALLMYGEKSLQVKMTPLIPLLIFMKFISDATGQTISLSCPSLQEGSIVGVNCSVPSSICAYTVVFFVFEINGGTPDRLCAVPSTQTCDMEPVGAMNCSCIQNVSDVKVYKLNFLGERAKYEGGKLTCSVDCSPAGQSCEPLRYTVTTSRSPSATTSSFSSSTKAGDTGNGSMG
ncbi:uncharacterized protein LOC112568099 [Pomacea canaliculata]|uniref:uncharacterized protein LOC112568099 n=1 Tax=Pomacea canaliculata TaxID=400727 RepID=UPI000D7396C4|nr:uncharacterized protein LOC112568099 [Pomacea canaliculata]